MIRVLVVDDNPSIVRGLTALFSVEPDLELCGYAVSGEGGLSLAVTLEPDVVIMDLSMPGMGGMAAIRAIVESGCASRVLVLSGTSSEDRRSAAVEAGALDYVRKSDAAHLLLASVRALAGTGPSPSHERGSGDVT
jgi:NarL family two-component system response regulator LiaR